MNEEDRYTLAKGLANCLVNGEMNKCSHNCNNCGYKKYHEILSGFPLLTRESIMQQARMIKDNYYDYCDRKFKRAVINAVYVSIVIVLIQFVLKFFGMF